MQTLQLNNRIETFQKPMNKDDASEKNSGITWRDIQGLTWLLEDDF